MAQSRGHGCASSGLVEDASFLTIRPHDLGNLLSLGPDQHNEVAMAEQRKNKRTKMVLPVKVSISGATHLAHTFDLTYVGARIGGLHTELKTDQIISLQRGSKKANYCVIWVQQLSPNTAQH